MAVLKDLRFVAAYFISWFCLYGFCGGITIHVKHLRTYLDISETRMGFVFTAILVTQGIGTAIAPLWFKAFGRRGAALLATLISITSFIFVARALCYKSVNAVTVLLALLYGLPQGVVATAVVAALRQYTKEASQPAYFLIGASGVSLGSMFTQFVTNKVYQYGRHHPEHKNPEHYGLELVFYFYAVLNILNLVGTALIFPRKSREFQKPSPSEETDESSIESSENKSEVSEYVVLKSNLSDEPIMGSLLSLHTSDDKRRPQFVQLCTQPKMVLLLASTYVYCSGAIAFMLYIGQFYEETLPKPKLIQTRAFPIQAGDGVPDLSAVNDITENMVANCGFVFYICEFFGRFIYAFLSKASGLSVIHIYAIAALLSGSSTISYGLYGHFSQVNNTPNMLLYNAMNCLCGIARSGFTGLLLGVLTSVTTKETFISGFGLMNLVRSAALASGPLIGGLIAQYVTTGGYWVVMLTIGSAGSCAGLMVFSINLLKY